MEELKEGTGPEVKQDNLLVCTMRENPAPRTSSLMPLTVPAAMTYGKDSSPPDIPPHSTLVFEVDCKFVK